MCIASITLVKMPYYYFLLFFMKQPWEMGVLRRSYFFADLQTILQEYGLACKNFFKFI